MPVTPTYPGVYIEEIPSGVRTIIGVSTSKTAFIGRAKYGPVNDPIEINNYGDFENKFGGLWNDSKMAFAVRDFYLNGGKQAIIVRITSPNFASDDLAETTQTTFKDSASQAQVKVKTAATDEAAKAGATGATVKAAAKVVTEKIITPGPNDPATDDGEKAGAKKALALINTLADTDDAAAVTKFMNEKLDIRLTEALT